MCTMAACTNGTQLRQQLLQWQQVSMRAESMAPLLFTTKPIRGYLISLCVDLNTPMQSFMPSGDATHDE
jgi:hypothetical protein